LHASSVACQVLAWIYVRKKDLTGIDPKHRTMFRTKLELAVEVLRVVARYQDCDERIAHFTIIERRAVLVRRRE
jgi:hypothetical protein